MQDFLSDLLSYCTEHSHPPCDDPQYQADFAAFNQLDIQIQAALGDDFLTRYEQLSHQYREWEYQDIFLQGLRFGIHFAFAVLLPPDLSQS